jgi:NAD+ kinase
VLKALHATLAMSPKPVFAMRTEGSIGFLGNDLRTDDLSHDPARASRITLYRLRAGIELAG